MRTPSALACALLLAGCQQWQFGRAPHASRPEDPNESRRVLREAAMNSEWQNRHLSHLLHERGAPVMIMNIPGGGNPPGFVAVYGVDRATGCIDAFAFLPAPDPVIRIYHCR